MRQYTEADCMEQAGKPYTIHRKIVVLSGKAALMEKSGQLFYCQGGIGSDLLHRSGPIVGISLRTGRKEIVDRGKVLGILRPGHLPWMGRKILASISPQEFGIGEPFKGYLCYCLLEDGSLAGGVWVESWEDVVAYTRIQKAYQDQIVVCDKEERVFLEIHRGCVINRTKLWMMEANGVDRVDKETEIFIRAEGGRFYGTRTLRLNPDICERRL